MLISLSMQFIVLFCAEKADLLFGHIFVAQHMDCCRHRRDNLNAEQQCVLDYLHWVTTFLNMRRAAHRSFRGAGSDRRAFPQSPPPSSRSRAKPVSHQLKRQMLGNAEKIVIIYGRILVVAAIVRILTPPTLESRVRCETSGRELYRSVDSQNLALLRFENIGGRF